MMPSPSYQALFVAPSAYVLGGLATWLDYVLPGLRSLGCRATLGLVEGKRHHKPQRYLAEHPGADWIAIPCLTGTPYGRRNAVKNIVKALSPDLVVSVNIPDALVAVAELREVGKRRRDSAPRAVMACHGIQADLFADMRRLKNSIDAVVCVNRLACDLAVSAGQLDPQRIHYAACGTKIGNPMRREIREPISIGFVGRLEENQKRVSDLVRIVPAIEQKGLGYRLLIAGTGPSESGLRRELHQRVSNGIVEFLGHVPADRMADTVYPNCDVLLITSSWETGPIVAWEAMAHGVVVVSSRYVGSGREGVLEDKCNALLFEIGDTDAAANCIRQLAYERDLVQAIRWRAWQTVRDRYSHTVSVSCWDRAFRKTLEAESRAAKLPPEARRSSGRLDVWLGPKWGERLRRIGGRGIPDHGPAGEWPHTLGADSTTEAEFWATAMEHDRNVLATFANRERRKYNELEETTNDGFGC